MKDNISTIIEWLIYCLLGGKRRIENKNGTKNNK